MFHWSGILCNPQGAMSLSCKESIDSLSTHKLEETHDDAVGDFEGECLSLFPRSFTQGKMLM